MDSRGPGFGVESGTCRIWDPDVHRTMVGGYGTQDTSTASADRMMADRNDAAIEYKRVALIK